MSSAILSLPFANAVLSIKLIFLPLYSLHLARNPEARERVRWMAVLIQKNYSTTCKGISSHSGR